MTANVKPYRGTTPYAASGNWPIVGLCLIILGMFWIRDRGRF
jgi:apolipoprotein N-acyltransferase